MKMNPSLPMDRAVRFLMSAHDAVPGITENVLNCGRTADGRSSYEVLADAAGLRNGMTVVDLACGSGCLASLISERVEPAGHVIGIDLNGSELALARTRFKSCGNVRFLQESAGNLSLPDSSADAVLCHMALMLFQPLDPVLTGIARILRPSGVLAAVLPSLNGGNALFSAIREALAAVVAKEVDAERRLALGNPETGSASALKNKLSQTGDFDASLQIVDYEVVFRDTPESLTQRFLPFFYYTALLSEAGKEQVRNAWTALFRKNLPDGEKTAEFRLPLSVFTVHKR